MPLTCALSDMAKSYSKHAINNSDVLQGHCKASALLQDYEARAVQCESDITFQRGQVRQSYIGTVCVQLQRHMTTYMMAAVAECGEPPEGVHPAAVDLVTSLVEIQADLVSLAPTACITQVLTLSPLSVPTTQPLLR